jgi:hypothetical protein
LRDIPDAERGFLLSLSARPFSGYSDKLSLRRANDHGGLYYSDAMGIEFWMSRDLLRQYRRNPTEIYLRADKGNLDPTRPIELKR